MLDLKISDFNIDQIANSGQCFRINRIPGTQIWKVNAFNKTLNVQQIRPNSALFDCSKGEFQKIWKNYFDLDRDYSKIKTFIENLEDPYLIEAVKFGYGLRILKQDLWETIVSFIISQRNSLIRIRDIIGKLCVPTRGLFPSPQELAQYDAKYLHSIGLGYRVKYLLQISEDASNGQLNLEHLKGLESKAAITYLKQFSGIGEKVATCIALFGLHKLDAFPIDTWIKRVIEKKYNGRLNISQYGQYAGIIQQYMFFYERESNKRTRAGA